MQAWFLELNFKNIQPMKKKVKKKVVTIKEKKNIPENIREVYNSTDGQTIPANKDDGIHRVIQVPEKVVEKIIEKNSGEKKEKWFP